MTFGSEVIVVLGMSHNSFRLTSKCTNIGSCCWMCKNGNDDDDDDDGIDSSIDDDDDDAAPAPAPAEDEAATVVLCNTNSPRRIGLLSLKSKSVILVSLFLLGCLTFEDVHVEDDDDDDDDDDDAAADEDKDE